MNQFATSMWWAPQSPTRPLPYSHHARNDVYPGLNGFFGASTCQRVPVESGRHLGDLLPILRIAAGLLDEHLRDVAEQLHLLLRFDEVIPAPLLRADLHDEIRILVIGVEHHVDARDVVRNRLLDEHVLARGECVGRDPGMREVGRANEHRVDVVPVEHTAIVADDVERLGERTITLEALLLGLARPHTPS